ncbi:hypothetical protein [Tolumonas lignilytica]|uniref:hypothetical protein n=1 Tax=Tolumonas lignilytica TaxID=1283284 RepID=UPI00046361F2|nr:hypothetical protein [Tolumonas lignilytica]
MYRSNSMHQQKGIAAILFTLIIGVSLLGIVMGAMHYSRSDQDSAIASHALTQAQMRAWSGAEGFRQYLYQIKSSGAASLAAGNAITFTGISGVTGTVVAVSTTATTCSSGTQVTANLTGTSANATATVQSVYCVTGGSGNTPPTIINTININGDLTLSGNISVINGSNVNTNFIVNGNISASGSISGFSLLYATGTVNLSGSQSNINTVSAEKDVTLSGSGTYTTINSLTNVTMSGGVSAVNVNTNGTTTLNSSAKVTTIKSIGNVALTGGGAEAANVYTDGNVTMSNGSITSLLMAQGNLTEASNGSVASGQIGGTVTKPDWNNNIHVTVVNGLTVPITPLTATTIKTTVIDAWPLKSSANLAFDVDASNNIKVTVSNMYGISNGTYFLVGSKGNQDYLCSTSTYNANTCYKKVCVGYSDYNSCFDYNTKTATWSLNGSMMAPGVIWFNGNVTAGNGTYNNTIIATGNIATQGSTSLYAPNYAGYSGVCVNSNFLTFYPTNFCQNGAYVSSPLGNIALLAGGYVSNVFSGGDISLGSSNDVHGDIMAGDLLSTTGSTKVYGYITISNQSNSTDGSSFKGSTTIDLSNLPATYDPSQVNSGGNNNNNNNNNNTPPNTSPNVSYVWSRYL